MNRCLWNRTQNRVVVPELEIASGFFGRLRGLLGRKSLPQDRGLLINKCRQVHMLFMKFPIDVIYCAKNHQVVHLEHDLRPWRISPVIRSADYIVELPAGALASTNIAVGDLVEVRSKNQDVEEKKAGGYFFLA